MVADIKIQKLLSIDDNDPVEYEIIVMDYYLRWDVSAGILNKSWQPIKRKKQTIGAFIIVDENEFRQIIANLFFSIDPEKYSLEYESKEYNPILSIIADIPDELRSLISDIYAKYLTAKEQKAAEEKRLQEEAEKRRKKEEEKRRKAEEERIKREAEERRQREEEEKRKEQERQKRLRLLEMPIPEEVLWLSKDSPDWLVEMVWKILRKELHPDRFQKFDNGIHRQMNQIFQDISFAYETIKKNRQEDWNIKTPLQLAEKKYSKGE